MIEIKTKLRPWGNSFGIVIPQKAVESTGVKAGEEVIILFDKKKNNVLRETFGTLKIKKSTQEIMDELDKELDSKF